MLRVGCVDQAPGFVVGDGGRRDSVGVGNDDEVDVRAAWVWTCMDLVYRWVCSVVGV